MSGSNGAYDAKRLAKIAISLIYFVGRALYRTAMWAAGHPAGQQLVVLCYHGLPDRYCQSFRRQLESLHRKARVLPAFHHGVLPAGRPNVAITFDDAYISVVKNALPELAGRKFHSTIFVPTGSLGRHPGWLANSANPDAAEVVMSAEQIAELPSPLVTIGSHTVSHPHLSQISLDDARRELEGSRRTLQALIAQDVGLLAFPHGDHDASTVELCKIAGYDQAFSITPEAVDPTASDFVRGRVRVDPFDGGLEFFLKYRGAYAWVSHVTSFKQRLKAGGRLRKVAEASY